MLLASGAISEMGVVPNELSRQIFAVGIDQQLVGIEPMAGIGLVRAMHAIAIKLSGRDVGKVAVPDIIRAFRQRVAAGFLPAGTVEQTQLDFAGIG